MFWNDNNYVCWRAALAFVLRHMVRHVYTIEGSSRYHLYTEIRIGRQYHEPLRMLSHYYVLLITYTR